jgi:regulator of replication initiation timing
MSNLSEEIKALEKKLRILTERYQELKEDHRLMKEENKRLTLINHELKDHIQNIAERDKTINLEKTFTKEQKETIKTKQIINEMMREIDQCLLLLDE